MDPSEENAIFLEAAAQLGFAVEGEDARDPQVRRVRAAIASEMAKQYVEDLTIWMNDDEDPEIRMTARGALQRCLYTAATAEHNERVSRTRPSRGVGLVTKLLQWTKPTNSRSNWWDNWALVRHVRRILLVLQVLLAGASVALLAFGHQQSALIPLVAMIVAVFGDRWFAQATRHESSYWPWVACVAGHVCDLALLGGVMLHLMLNGARGPYAALVAVAALASLLASFVRVSALQTGLRFLWNPAERVTRWAAVVAYVMATPLAGTRRSAAAVAVSLILVAVAETALVVRRAWRANAKSSWPHLLIVNRENGKATTNDPNDINVPIETEGFHHVLTNK